MIRIYKMRGKCKTIRMGLHPGPSVTPAIYAGIIQGWNVDSKYKGLEKKEVVP